MFRPFCFSGELFTGCAKLNPASQAVFTKLFCVKYKMILSGIKTRTTIMIHSITDQKWLAIS